MQTKNETDCLPKDSWGISQNTLKLIAIIFMFIDHIGAFLLYPYILKSGSSNSTNLYEIYMGMRIAGRIAFPLFIFCIVEGVEKTKHPMKYFYLLGTFALVSEIPFNLCESGNVMDLGKSNVFFTLFAGVGILLCVQGIFLKDSRIKISVAFPLTVIGLVFGFLFGFDYGGIGVCAIVLAGIFNLGMDFKYQRRKNFIVILIITIILFFMGQTERYAILAIPIALMYNGQRGRSLKYFFYVFYPAHLMVLFVIRMLLNKSV